VQLEAITDVAFGNKCWVAARDYRFMAKRALLPVAGFELAKLLLNFPMAFVRDETGYRMVVVCGFHESCNLFVLHDGRWAASYVPSWVRLHPFYVAVNEHKETVLCFDVESGLLSDHGEHFFEGSEPSVQLKQIREHLSMSEASTRRLQVAVDSLELAKLLIPWPIRLEGDGGTSTQVEGLFVVDEQALMALDPEQLGRLQQAGAIQVAMGQLFSMQHVELLGQLGRVHALQLPIDPVRSAYQGQPSQDFLDLSSLH